MFEWYDLSICHTANLSTRVSVRAPAPCGPLTVLLLCCAADHPGRGHGVEQRARAVAVVSRSELWSCEPTVQTRA